MENRTRKEYVSLNILAGSASQVVSLVLQLISRTIFLNTLGIEYLGVSAIFFNILTVLSLADLGFGTAIVYSMYKPLAENDTDTVVALMTYYKKIYSKIAILVAAIGIGMIPLLPYVVNLKSNISHLTIYYLLYVINIVISYFMAYKYTIISADQKDYLLSVYSLMGSIIQTILQILILLVFKNFMLYLFVMILRTFLVNWFQTKKAKKLYPYIKESKELDSTTKKSINENVKSMFLYKLGGVLLNNTDNFIISMIVGTVYVGFYSNYLTVISAVTNFVVIIFNSLTHSVGNLNANNDKDRQFEIFRVINFIAFWIMTFCSVCFLILLNDFVTLWIGEEYVFGMLTVIVIVLNFFMPGTISDVSIYRDTTGMFKQTKYVFLLTAFINLVLSIILGKIYGIFGVLLATVISRLLTNMWYEPFILFKTYFKKSPLLYFRRQGFYWIVFAITSICTYLLCSIFKTITIVNLILKLMICILVPNIIIIALFFKNKEFEYIYEQIIKKITNKFKFNKKV
ncbi:MAG: lipopolysaccharide biosynthesis protein [Mobilitalea sp.]